MYSCIRSLPRPRGSWDQVLYFSCHLSFSFSWFFFFFFFLSFAGNQFVRSSHDSSDDKPKLTGKGVIASSPTNHLPFPSSHHRLHYQSRFFFFPQKKKIMRQDITHLDSLRKPRQDGRGFGREITESELFFFCSNFFPER